jgi:hypothetical protein
VKRCTPPGSGATNEDNSPSWRTVPRNGHHFGPCRHIAHAAPCRQTARVRGGSGLLPRHPTTAPAAFERNRREAACSRGHSVVTNV